MSDLIKTTISSPIVPQKIFDFLGTPLDAGALLIVCAFLIDLLIGDPPHLPHPVRIIGKAVSMSEGIVRKFSKTHFQELIGGMIIVAGIASGTFIFTYLFLKAILTLINGGVLPDRAWGIAVSIFGLTVVLYIASTTIALKDLIDSARAVINELAQNRIQDARKKLGMIVGRDTDSLDEKRILMATIETVSENLSDGVIAPLFYLSIGGLPLAMTYKAINTMDSMLGYKDERYRYLGWAAARLDDMANYIPSRITGWLIVASVSALTFFKDTSRTLTIAHRSIMIMLRDGKKHLSPNAGIPEAAVAGAIGVRLGGTSTYRGVLVEKPYIGYDMSEDYFAAFDSTINIVRVASLIGVITAAMILYMRGAI